MFDIELFLETPSFSLEDFNIPDEILTAMLKSVQIDLD